MQSFVVVLSQAMHTTEETHILRCRNHLLRLIHPTSISSTLLPTFRLPRRSPRVVGAPPPWHLVGPSAAHNNPSLFFYPRVGVHVPPPTIASHWCRCWRRRPTALQSGGAPGAATGRPLPWHRLLLLWSRVTGLGRCDPPAAAPGGMLQFLGDDCDAGNGDGGSGQDTATSIRRSCTRGGVLLGPARTLPRARKLAMASHFLLEPPFFLGLVRFFAAI